jgi:hypothetical protein
MADVNPVQIQKYLRGVDYPASKEDLIKHAEREGADQSVLSMLERLPDGRYQTPADVSEAIGQLA